jgi:hypothetical protein
VNLPGGSRVRFRETITDPEPAKSGRRLKYNHENTKYSTPSQPAKNPSWWAFIIA